MKADLQRPLNPPEQTRLYLSCKRVFPYAQHPPASTAQPPRHQNIARLVADEFIFPESAVAFRLRSVLGATVPETAVNEDCQLVFWKDEIRPDTHSLSALGRGPG